MPRYSIIIPVYNRPDELKELLQSLSGQSYRDFEVIVVEDGSGIRSEEVVRLFQDRLNISYYYKENGGQGYARNYGFERASGDFFILLDSDALVEPGYLSVVDRNLQTLKLDLYGGPDTDHPGFTPVQKAISYAMTSVFTTGGIRGKKSNLGGTFHPRSFNMGLAREVWEKTGGFRISRMGEDIILSITALRMGFRSALLPEAFIYHKRRTSFRQFFRQLKFFGRARINIARFYPEELKAVHFFPLLFLSGVISLPFLYFFARPLFYAGCTLLLLFSVLVLGDAFRKSGHVKMAFLSLIASFIQLFGSGLGFLQEGWKRLWEPKSHRETGAHIEYPS